MSSKFFWGLTPGVNTRNTLNRKYLLHAIEGSLERFGVDFLDLVFCHRPDPETPVEETVEAMTDIIESGKAHYWGTSEWSADEIRAAWDVADSATSASRSWSSRNTTSSSAGRSSASTPACTRTSAWVSPRGARWRRASSPASTSTASREDSRAALPGYEWLRDALTDERRNGQVVELMGVAEQLDVTVAQLAIAWCAANPHVSTVITGASVPSRWWRTWVPSGRWSR